MSCRIRQGSLGIERARRIGVLLALGSLPLSLGCKNPPDPPSDDAGSAGADASGNANGGQGNGGADAATDGGHGNGATDGSSATDDGSLRPDSAAASFPLPNGIPATVLLDGAELAAVQQQLAGGTGVSAAQRAAPFKNLLSGRQRRARRRNLDGHEQELHLRGKR